MDERNLITIPGMEGNNFLVLDQVDSADTECQIRDQAAIGRTRRSDMVLDQHNMVLDQLRNESKNQRSYSPTGYFGKSKENFLVIDQSERNSQRRDPTYTNDVEDDHSYQRSIRGDYLLRCNVRKSRSRTRDPGAQRQYLSTYSRHRYSVSPRRVYRSDVVQDRPYYEKHGSNKYKRARDSSSSTEKSRTGWKSRSYKHKSKRGRMGKGRYYSSSESEDREYISNTPLKRYSRSPNVNASKYKSVSATRRPTPHETNNSNVALDKFLDVIRDLKGQSNSKLTLCNVVPEFDPMSKDQSILTWLTKVEECAEIYGWSEKEIIHFSLPKLSGIAKSWYQGLSTVLYTWNEWKRKLIESFPSREDYAELLTTMLAKKVRYGDSLEYYYYEKMNLLNRCDIRGRKAVDCILHGIEDRAVRVGAQAARFREPEGLLGYLKTVKVSTNRDHMDKTEKFRHERKTAATGMYANRSLNSSNQNRVNYSQRPSITCHNCKKDGHKSVQCRSPPSECTICGKLGHLNEFCKFNHYSIRDKPPQASNAKEERQVSVLHSAGKTNSKYVIDVLVNDMQLSCYVDLGSQCTLLRESEANKLQLCLDTEDLPIMRVVGGHSVQPLGRAILKITVQGITENVEVFVVEDTAINQPILLGHTFTELPNITIIKTSDELLFQQTKGKISLRIQSNFMLAPREIGLVPVSSSDAYSGNIYINGTVRGDAGKEYYLMPGEYSINLGVGRILALNMSEQVLKFDKHMLLTRCTTVVDSVQTCAVAISGIDSNDALRCGPNVTNQQRAILDKLLIKYKKCFSTNLKDLGLTNMGEMVIELENSDPVVYRPYRMSIAERCLVRDMIDEMLETGIVRESSSPYASPIVLVKKKTGEKRLCVDYRALNKRTKKDHYPLPRVEDQLDQLAGNNLFISLDLASGYYQIPIAASSQDKTAFITPDGQYEYTRMPFGLVNAPSVFQRTINKILLEAKIKFALVYMDDILIPARTFEEGIERLEKVLSLLKEGGLTLKLSKCFFFYEQIDFLGYEVSCRGIRPGSRKIEAVSKFPAPTNQHEVRQFIGLASFFRRFVRDFAVISKPLTDLLKKDSKWKWLAEEEKSFNTIKNALISRPLLALYDPQRETQLHTDACKYGVAGILLQKGEEDAFRPVSYFSRKTTIDEQRLHSYELETLAVISSLSRFRVYLLGIPFKILTDCNALRTTLTKRDLIPRIARWWIQLQEFDCDIEYRPGTRMAHVDALSRNAVETAKLEDHVIDVLAVDIEDWITTVQANDDEISRIKDILNDPESEKIGDILKNYKIKGGKVYRYSGSTEDAGLRWVVPKGVRWQVTKMNHDDIGHFGFEKTLNRIQQTFWFPKMRRFVKKYVRSCLQCAHHKGTTGKQSGMLHPIERNEIPFHTVHADHLGPFVRSKVGNMYLLVLVDSLTKFINMKPVRNTKSSTTIKVLREHISYFGAPTRLITDQGTSFTSNTFRMFVNSQGIKHIKNAVATPRANGQVERFNRTILDALSTKCHGKDDRTWDDNIPDIQIGLNTTVHKTTGKSASELLFGFRVKSGTENILSEVLDAISEPKDSENLQEIRRDAVQRISEKQIKDKERFDAKRNNVSFNTGDLVSVRREIPSDGKSKKLSVKYQGPYRVVKVLPNDRYLIEDTPLTRKKGNRQYQNIIAVDKMKPWLSFNKDFSDAESDGGDSSS